MNLLTRMNWWRRAQTGVDDDLLDREGLAWLASLSFHFLLVLGIAFMPTWAEPPEHELTFIVPLDSEDEELVEQIELPPVIISAEELLPEIGASSRGDAEEPPMLEIEPISSAFDPQTLAGTEFISEPVSLLSLSSRQQTTLFERMTGAGGELVHTSGDAGSVERITQEILAQLEESSVLAMWLMDASESLRPRRQEIIEHFDRVYEELGELVEDSGQPLLTSVAAFGEKTVFMLPEPTDDRQAIQRAVRSIAADESGMENIFSALGLAVTQCAKFARTGRKVMIIVVTDERGDDSQTLNPTLKLLKQHNTEVHVIGPLAPFGREQVEIKWTDPETGVEYLLPVDRGPESVQIEHARLAIWKNGPGANLISSGFGPFGLMRVTHESGGLYLAHDAIGPEKPEFAPGRIARYQPDYLGIAEYAQLATDHPLRKAVLRVAEATNVRFKSQLPNRLLAAGIQFEIREARKTLDDVAQTLERALQELNAARDFRGREPSRRWQAHYDLLVARVLANRLRCDSYGRLLDVMYQHPKAPDDGVHNAWEITGHERANGSPADGDAATPTTEFASVRTQLQRVIDEHPDTPWAAIAKEELEFPLAFQWREAFMDPPEGIALPWDKVPWDKLTEAQKSAKAAYENRRAARRPQQRPAGADETPRRAPPKL